MDRADGLKSDTYGSSKDFDSAVGGNIAKQTHLHETEDLGKSGDINSLCSGRRLYQQNIAEEELLLSTYQQEQQLQLFSHFRTLDDLYLDFVSPPFQLSGKEISKVVSFQSEDLKVIKSKKEKAIISPSASLRILKNYGNRFQRLNGEKINLPGNDIVSTKVSDQKLSAGAIIRLAGEKFIQSCSQMVDEVLVVDHSYPNSFLGLSDEEMKDVELLQCLLASAEKVAQQQFDRASKDLNQCDDSSSDKGTPIQRLVYYFSEALREKIDRETGKVTLKGLGKKWLLELEEAMMSPNPTCISVYQNVPFVQVSVFTGVQTVVDNVAKARKVHVIYLEIRGGMHCTVLMSTLAARREYPLEHLKITAIGTRSKPKIVETGKRLISFAQSINLSFSFKIVMVADMLDLNEDLFELDYEEVVVVYSSYLLRTMISWPDRLECLMKVMRNINPCVMVVIESEANHNSPSFVKRFIEAVFFYGAFFDSLEDCMCHDEQNRMIAESMYFSPAIRNIVAAEGEERTMRHVNFNVWRDFFARFGMVEMDLSMLSLNQADMMLKDFACGSSCTLDLDGKSLIIGWKGTPIHSFSAWKFL
ncbi:unnamed protein product [Ilex paraguariensis]|uniref:DELLA RGL1-like protein n=1 Tax=Ilex paraguariensis TaxID=185542 RepID=A0ABC8S6I4_9AQUA